MWENENVKVMKTVWWHDYGAYRLDGLTLTEIKGQNCCSIYHAWMLVKPLIIHIIWRYGVQITGTDKKPKCKESRCECPCYNATVYNYCSGHFAVTKYALLTNYAVKRLFSHTQEGKMENGPSQIGHIIVILLGFPGPFGSKISYFHCSPKGR